MSNINKFVEFLELKESLRLGESPWGTYDENEDIHQLNWDRLSRVEELDLNDDFLDNVKESLGKGPRPDATNSGRGWDKTCAWYQPIHFFGYDFGIFIREDCVKRQAVEIARFMKRPSARFMKRPSRDMFFQKLATRLIRAAVYAFFLHEHYHHKMESLGFRLHVTTGGSCYLPYFENVYNNLNLPPYERKLEEALANADSFRRLGENKYWEAITPPVIRALRDNLRWSFPLQGLGYREAVNYLKDTAFYPAENLLKGRMKEGKLNPNQPTSDWVVAPQLTRSILSVNSYIWWVVPSGAVPMVPTAALPIRTCSTADMIKLCEKRDYQQVAGGKGSHVKLKKQNCPTMILPGDRKNLSPGVAREALRTLGDYSIKDLPKLLSSS